MAFPTTAVLDTFNRADEGPPPSANWSDSWVSAAIGLQVVSNALAGFGGRSSWWNVSTFGPDCEAYYTSVALRATYVGLRLTTPGAGTTDGYFAYFDRGGGSYIYRVDNGAQTQLGAVDPTANGATDLLGFEAVGTTLTVYRNTGGGWASGFSRTDGTYSSAGYIGMGMDGAGVVATADDFGGGTIAGPDTGLAWIKA